MRGNRVRGAGRRPGVVEGADASHRPERRSYHARDAAGVQARDPMRTVTAVCLCLAAASTSALAQDVPRPASDDSASLAAVAAVVDVFRRSGDAFWPGYDLSTQPFLVYHPDQWAVLVNPRGAAAGYVPYPASWPALGAPALLRTGPIEGFAGQLVFDYPSGDTTVVAVPILTETARQLGSPWRYLFAFITHEAFHQFQRSAFREIDTPAEEAYPILDARNNALAALEMHVLRDAALAAEARDTATARHLAALFAAVRHARWQRASASVREYERAKEITEGTAKYVETRAVAALAARCRSRNATAAGECPWFDTLTAGRYLAADFTSRFTAGALRPGDVPRNRIYPVAATVGLLLDFFGVPWKAATASAADSFTTAGLLDSSLHLSPVRLGTLEREAERRYGFAAILATSERLVAEYHGEYQRALTAFEAQPGFRVEVQLPASSTSRSRSSTGARWAVNEGRTVLSERFVVYTLRRPAGELFLKVEGRSLLDETVEGGQRRITFYVPDVARMEADGTPLSPGAQGGRRFASLRIETPGFSLQTALRGTLAVRGRTVSIRLERAGP